MPCLGSRFSSWTIDNLTSWLGLYNPFARAYDPETEALWLLDNVAWRSPTYPYHWTAEFVAAYFLKNSGKELAEVASYLGRKLGVEKGSRNEETMRQRLKPFVDTILPARTVYVSVGDEEEELRLGPGGRNGISANVLKMPGYGDYDDGDRLDTVAATGQESAEMCMTTVFAEPEGWAVISDIDDTIKITLTPSPLGILHSTFIAHPTPVPGMPELYAHVQARLGGPPFFYLSASPYNLYPFLRAFLHAAPYPAGTLVLRDASWMNLAGFLASLTRGTLAYKVGRMHKIRGWLPHRKMMCVGDSTQSDPEAYAALYRAHPVWVRRIFIRRVAGVAEMDEDRKNGAARFERAFAGVPGSVWTVFDEPVELYAAVDALAKEDALVEEDALAEEEALAEEALAEES